VDGEPEQKPGETKLAFEGGDRESAKTQERGDGIFAMHGQGS
jgi:hypothetical protein